jgi:apolipoprotein N-acyltransferase
VNTAARPPSTATSTGVALAIASGVLQGVALPPVGFWPLAFVSAVPLLWAMRGAAPSRALLLGTVQGAVCAALMSTWLPATIASFTALSLPASALLSALPWLYHGARTGAAAAVFAYWGRLRGGAIVGWPIAVAATELTYPMLFPWYSAEQVAASPAFCQLAELGGPVLVSVALAAVNAAFATALLRLATPSPRRWHPLGATLVAGILLWAYGVARLRAVDRTTLEAPAALIAVVQPNVTNETRRDPATLEEARQRTAERSRDGAALIVWPESVFDHVVDESERSQWAAGLVDALGARSPDRSPLLIGTYLAPTEGPKRPSNALLLVDGEGAITGIYRKQKPLMFGEYVPFADVFPALDRWLPRAGRLTAGTSFTPLLVGGHRITPLVCYEDLIPSFVRESVRRERPELLIDAANDAWFGQSSAWQHHVALARFRAIEHRRFFVRAGNNAGSVVIDPVGRIVAELPPYMGGSLSHEVRWLDAATPYERYGDTPLLVLCVVAGLTRIVRGRTTSRPRLHPTFAALRPAVRSRRRGAFDALVVPAKRSARKSRNTRTFGAANLFRA